MKFLKKNLVVENFCIIATCAVVLEKPICECDYLCKGAGEEDKTAY